MAITTDTGQALPTGTWALDPVHSTIGFEVPYLVGTFRGRFDGVDAKLDVSDNAASIVGSARVNSVVVQDENLVTHLQSPDFFDAERYPVLRFQSREIERAGDELTVRGDITIKGVTQPVELAGSISDPISDGYGNDRIGVRLETTVDRTDFGLIWNLPLPSGELALANDVKLEAELYFVREA
jgi:polyisoprenoid-binding protein YceI